MCVTFGKVALDQGPVLRRVEALLGDRFTLSMDTCFKPFSDAFPDLSCFIHAIFLCIAGIMTITNIILILTSSCMVLLLCV